MAWEPEPEPDEAEQRRRQRRVRWIMAGTILFGCVWAFAIWYSIRGDRPEQLETADFQTLDAACDEALADLRTLPNLDAQSNALDAVALTRDENEIFTRVVETGRAIEASGDAALALRKWLDDWETVIDLRAEYVDELEATGEGRFLSPLEVVLRMSTYAETQGLETCRPETLLIDVVDIPRDYPEVTL